MPGTLQALNKLRLRFVAKRKQTKHSPARGGSPPPTISAALSEHSLLLTDRLSKRLLQQQPDNLPCVPPGQLASCGSRQPRLQRDTVCDTLSTLEEPPRHEVYLEPEKRLQSGLQ